MPDRESIPGTQAVHRAISLLRSFSSAQPELSLAELTRITGIKKATAHRLLAILEQEGLVARSQSEAYRLGPEVLNLGSIAQHSLDVRTVARPELIRLAQMTRETATLEILSNAETLVLDEAFGGRLVSTSQSIGSRWPLYATSTGKAILAYLPEAQREKLITQPFTAFTGHTFRDSDELLQDLEMVKRRGWSTACEELEPGFTAVGAPVFDREGYPLAAISLGGPTARLTPEILPQIGERVKEAAARISMQFGFLEK